MRKISSLSTFFYKRVFPAVWFVVLALIACFAISQALRGPNPAEAYPALIVLVVMAGLGYVLFRALIFDLVDEVYLGEDELVVRNGGDEDRIAMSNIVNVSGTQFVSPERITLTLREPCKFGSEVTFSPTMRMFPFSRHPMEKELIRLVHGVGNP